MDIPQVGQEFSDFQELSAFLDRYVDIVNFARDTDMIVYCDIPHIIRWAVTIIHFVGY